MLADNLFKQLTPWLGAKRWLVGFSGGMDSTVLLHLLVTLRQRYQLPELSAIYIHHGLQEVAEAWPAHCQRVCDGWGVPLQVINVTVAKQASIEEAARNARYQAFSELLGVNEVLFTAQHQNDQAETLLFRLVRGSGVRGLASIPRRRPLGVGSLVRPLLSVPYNSLKEYALAHQLAWIEDPSNSDMSFARNYIRHQVIPLLTKQWPNAIEQIGQATSHLQEAQLLLNELAEQDLQAAQIAPLYPWLTVPSLLVEPLAKLSLARQKNALSYWLSQHTLLPTSQHWQGWLDLLTAKDGANPIWQLHQAALHRANGRIWLLTGQWLRQPSYLKERIIADATLLLDHNGQVNVQGKLPDDGWFVGYRQGGEVMGIAKRGHRDLKRLFNEQGVPNFLRQRIPLLFDQQGNLLAVANFPAWQDSSIAQSLVFEWLPDA